MKTWHLSFDVVSIGEKISVYMSVVLEKNLRYIIHEDEFVRAPNCFERKKSYAEDILWGLDYLHNKRLCLMNLNDANIYIHSQTDKAIISNFSCLTLSERAKKCNVVVLPLYRAPELYDESECFVATAAEMWTCGVMMFQIFTGHKIPDICRYDEVFQRIANLHMGILIDANKGALITSNTFLIFRNFLDLFLNLDPVKRSSAKHAAISPFLQNSRYLLDERFGSLWKSYSPDIEVGISSPSYKFINPSSFNDSHKSPQTTYNISKEVANNKEKLKIHFPWNKFINLNYVSNEQSNRKTDNQYHSSYEQDNKMIRNSFDEQQNSSKILAFKNVFTDDEIPESSSIVCKPFENIYSSPETTKNNSYFEMNTEIQILNNASNCSLEIQAPFTSLQFSPKNGNFTTTKNSTSDENAEIHGYGNSIVHPTNVTTNLRPEVFYSNFCDSDESLDFSSDLDEKSANHFENEASRIEENNDQGIMAPIIQDINTETVSSFDTGINKFHYFYGKKYVEIPRSYSDSTLYSFTSRINSPKKNYWVNQNQSYSSYRSWNSNLILSSVECNTFSNISAENKYIYPISIKKTDLKKESQKNKFSNLEEHLPFSTYSTSEHLEEKKNESNDTIFKRNFSNPLKNRFSQSPKLHTCIFTSRKNNLIHYKSETSLLNISNALMHCKNEISIDLQKMTLLNRTEESKVNNLNDKLQFNSETINGISNYKYFSTIDVSNTTNKKNENSLIEQKINFNLSRRHSYTCAMMHSIDLTEDKCLIDRCFLNEEIRKQKKTVEKQLMHRFSDEKTIDLYERKQENKMYNDMQSSNKNIAAGEANEDASNLDQCDIEINMKIECSDFTEVPLNSADIISKDKKKRKKDTRRKSWFRLLCPGCKVYYDDKEELFSGIT
ncbi:protein kinase domain-containing protein [Caerostris darwini]|uniref:non-specific serine/threonine protein kinase n=1 Tax=Caerostris darwini TaxID=1538125 RepID=A0AAV4RIL5_9ARAC|nr:protein kinase domain-containing protein [Caerostris darwini]